MEKFTTIFDILYKYKETIQDEDYLIMSNQIMELYNLAKSNQRMIKEEQDVRCFCHGNRFTCFNSIYHLRNCRKYQEFIEINPVVELLYNDVPITLTREPNYENYNEATVVTNLSHLGKLFLNIISQSSYTYKMQKIILSVAHLDYIMRNMSIVKKIDRYRDIVLAKIDNFSNDPDFFQFISQYDFDVNIWKFAIQNSVAD